MFKHLGEQGLILSAFEVKITISILEWCFYLLKANANDSLSRTLVKKFLNFYILFLKKKNN